MREWEDVMLRKVLSFKKLNPLQGSGERGLLFFHRFYLWLFMFNHFVVARRKEIQVQPLCGW